MYKIKTMNAIAEAGLQELVEAGLSVSADEAQPDGMLIRSANLHTTEFADNMLAIARAGAGTNNVPVARCTEAGICVFNSPGANSEAVKELAICALLMASRDVLGGIEWVRSIAGDGDKVAGMIEKGKSAFVGPEIAGKTLGVVGLGAVGAKLANAALALGMKVYGYDPYLSVDAAWQLSREVKHAVDLPTIYKNCDYISVHVPYMDSTHHMLNAEAFAQMKDGVRILNLARAELVDDEAMVAALDTAKVACYVTDFPNGVTAGLPHVVPIPHLGASTPESEEKCAIMAAAELVDYLKDGNIRNSVNMPAAVLNREGVARLCVFHRNVPKMINRFLDLVSAENINIAHMINKSRGEYAYTIIDLDAVPGENLFKTIDAMEEVLRVRII